jgi:hypothetical protein
MTTSTTSAQLRDIWAPDGASKPRRRKPAAPEKNKRRLKKRTFDPAKTNPAFEACYRGHVVPEGEWAEFMHALRAPLPTTFSFVATGTNEVAPSLIGARFEALLATLDERHRMASVDGADAAPQQCVASGSRVKVRLQSDRRGVVRSFMRVEAVPEARYALRLPWFPGDRGWQVGVTRKELAALRSTCRELRGFIEAHAQLGRLNRQEAVSMLPPLLLQVRARRAPAPTAPTTRLLCPQGCALLHSERPPPHWSQTYLAVRDRCGAGTPSSICARHLVQRRPFFSPSSSVRSLWAVKKICPKTRVAYWQTISTQ